MQSCHHKKKNTDKVYTHCDEIEHIPVTVCSWFFVTIAPKGQRSFKIAKQFVLQKILYYSTMMEHDLDLAVFS